MHESSSPLAILLLLLHLRRFSSLVREAAATRQRVDIRFPFFPCHHRHAFVSPLSYRPPETIERRGSRVQRTPERRTSFRSTIAFFCFVVSAVLWPVSSPIARGACQIDATIVGTSIVYPARSLQRSAGAVATPRTTSGGVNCENETHRPVRVTVPYLPRDDRASIIHVRVLSRAIMSKISKVGLECFWADHAKPRTY